MARQIPVTTLKLNPNPTILKGIFILDQWRSNPERFFNLAKMKLPHNETNLEFQFGVPRSECPDNFVVGLHIHSGNANAPFIIDLKAKMGNDPDWFFEEKNLKINKREGLPVIIDQFLTLQKEEIGGQLLHGFPWQLKLEFEATLPSITYESAI